MEDIKDELLDAEDWLINHCVMKPRYRFRKNEEVLSKIFEMERDIRDSILPYWRRVLQIYS